MERSVTFIRHGQAAPALDGNDRARVLTGPGSIQALARKEGLREVGISNFDMVCSSTATRTLETAEIICGWNRWHIRQIPEMYPDPKAGEGAVIDRMFSELGYARLTAYLAHENANTILAHGVEVWRQLRRRVIGSAVTLVTGHAVLLPSTAVAACSSDGMFLDKLAACNLGEAEGFTIRFDEWRPVEFIPHK